MTFKHPAVLLFGAGATRGGLAANAIPPPLDKDFFEVSAQIRNRGTPKLAHKVLKDVRDLYGRTVAVGLEEYYRDIEARAKIGSFATTANKPKDWLKRQKDLEALIRRVVLQTTCQEEQGHLTASASESHTAILERLKQDDSILTFNYDLVIEASLKNANMWNPRDGYGEEFHGVTGSWSKNWIEDRQIGNEQEPRSSRVQLLKLHGSVNWTLYKNKLVRLKPRPLVVRTNRTSPVFDKISILPPGFDKKIDKNPYKKFWKTARLKMEKCNTIIIIGYSLPDADILAKALFAEVVRKRAARKHFLRQLHLADPSDSVKQKLTELFVPALNEKTMVFKYKDLSDFVSKIEN